MPKRHAWLDEVSSSCSLFHLPSACKRSKSLFKPSFIVLFKKEALGNECRQKICIRQMRWRLFQEGCLDLLCEGRLSKSAPQNFGNFRGLSQPPDEFPSALVTPEFRDG